MAEVITYVRYAESIEQTQPGESETNAELDGVVHRSQVLLHDRYRHAVRFAHSKSHGILRADLTVDAGLPEELRQGLFAAAGSYPAIVRFSTAPGDLMADSLSTPRGMAVKVFGPAGQVMLPEHAGETTQDFVFVNAKTFAARDAAAFLGQQKIIEKNLNDPEIVKKAISQVARGTNAVLGLVGLHSGTLEQVGAPETHVLGETYGSTVAIRYGDYFGKLAFTPLSENLKSLTGKHVNVNFHYSGLKDAVVEFFKTETAVWEVGVQLCVDSEKMPVEDASKPWSEELSPYRRVGLLTAGPQDAYSPARQVYADEILSFNPWHALAAHQPLGNIMRARRSAYAASSKYRRTMNGRETAEPKSIDEFPG